jgi:hypothetical protein
MRTALIVSALATIVILADDVNQHVRLKTASENIEALQGQARLLQIQLDQYRKSNGH